MAEHGWITTGVVSTLAGAGDQVLIDKLPNGARNQAIASLAMLTAGIVGRLTIKNPKYRWARNSLDGLLYTGAALAGQSGAHYVDHQLLAPKATSSTSAASTPASSTTSASSASSATSASSTSASSSSGDTGFGAA